MSIREENEHQCNKAPRPSKNNCINNSDNVWNTIIARLPATALILRDMEEVINDAQTLLINLKTKTNSQNIQPHQLQSSITNDTNHDTSIKSTKSPNVIGKKINDKSIRSNDLDDSMTINHTCKSNDSLDEWNEFSGEKKMEPSRPSTAIHSTSSSSSSCLFHNAQSTNAFEQVKVGKSMTDDALYEIGKINVLNYDGRMENYESTIPIAKQAKEIVKNIGKIPTLTMKDLVLAPIIPRVCPHVGDTAINNSHQLLNKTKGQNINKKSPRQRLQSPTLEKPSAIPRRIPNKVRASTH
ncbi:hypothetical protein PV327_007864 [Microctonus hyperodae]|uniref:Uncharacterized protein n=1 Tax=Microctonus hyperodae TaxID=165561 RepID=A0AA39G0F0_MICHY|nr:hypothetical protein PV327_007864 [Microctonus hyperodae]